MVVGFGPVCSLVKRLYIGLCFCEMWFFGWQSEIGFGVVGYACYMMDNITDSYIGNGTKYRQLRLDTLKV